MFNNKEKNGEYSISIDFYSGDSLLNKETDYVIYSKELYGNPYAFTDELTHFVVLPFKIKDITEINRIGITLITQE